MFKVGDSVRVTLPGPYYVYEGSYVSDDNNSIKIKTDTGETLTICKVWNNQASIIENLSNNERNKIVSTIKEKFVLALTSEPKKSFRKAGVTNGDDLLTDDGQKIFLTWLLHTKHADEFKTAVVDGLLADTDKE